MERICWDFSAPYAASLFANVMQLTPFFFFWCLNRTWSWVLDSHILNVVWWELSSGSIRWWWGDSRGVEVACHITPACDILLGLATAAFFQLPLALTPSLEEEHAPSTRSADSLSVTQQCFGIPMTEPSGRFSSSSACSACCQPPRCDYVTENSFHKSSFHSDIQYNRLFCIYLSIGRSCSCSDVFRNSWYLDGY